MIYLNVIVCKICINQCSLFSLNNIDEKKYENHFIYTNNPNIYAFPRSTVPLQRVNAAIEESVEHNNWLILNIHLLSRNYKTLFLSIMLPLIKKNRTKKKGYVVSIYDTEPVHAQQITHKKPTKNCVTALLLLFYISKP